MTAVLIVLAAVLGGAIMFGLGVLCVCIYVAKGMRW